MVLKRSPSSLAAFSLLLQISFHVAGSFTASDDFYRKGKLFSAVSVTPVSCTADAVALADLRFDEWIQGVYHDTTRDAFRAATVEMYAERVADGATAFLARLECDRIIGSAELSPIELRGAATMPRPHGILYVTDVITSRLHRRKGVAHALMAALENAAVVKGSTKLLLHVDPTNGAALHFYQSPKVGYSEAIPANVLASLDVDRLAENADTKGQILLFKSLP